MDAGRQAEAGIDFLPVTGVPGRQRCTETKRASRQERVLYRWINRRAGRAIRVLSVLEAGHDPYRRLAKNFRLEVSWYRASVSGPQFFQRLRAVLVQGL
jgi:F420-0:gamma-glutamyl ligase-like protein